MQRLTKRQFLGRMMLAAGSAATTSVLAACGSAPLAPTAAPVKPAEPTKPAPAATAAVPKPAEAPKPTAAPTMAAPAAKPTAAKEPVTLRFHMRAGGEKSEPGIYVQRPQEWEQETGYKVKLEPIAGADYAPKLMALAASNTIGDITWTNETPNNFHSQFVKAKVLEPVDAFLGPHNVKKGEWFQVAVDTLTYDGKLYGLPKNSHPGAPYIYVNLKMFDEAGLKRPETYGASFEDVATWANKLSKGPKDRRDVYGLAVYVGNIIAITNGVRRFGGDVIDKDGVTSLADTEPWWEWATWHNRLINVDKVHPQAEAQGTQGIQGMFGSGKLAMFNHERGVYRATRIAVGDKFPWTTIQFPKVANPRGWGAIIATHTGTAASKHKDETFTLVYALADRRMAYITAKEEGYLTARVDNLEAIGDLANDPFLKLQYKCMEEEEVYWRPKNLRSVELETATTNHLDLLWLGKRDLDRAYLVELKKVMNDVLAKPA